MMFKTHSLLRAPSRWLRWTVRFIYRLSFCAFSTDSLYYTDAFAIRLFASFLWVFSRFSRLFTWCNVAGKTSLTPSHVRHSLCSNPGTKTRSSTIVSAILLRIQSSSCLSCFWSSKTSLSRRACRHLAGSGSALQVKVGTEGLKQCS